VREEDIDYTITVRVFRTGIKADGVVSSPTGTVTGQPDYAISLNPSIDKDFGSAVAGSPMEAYEVTVTNIGKGATGALSIGLTGDTAGFTLSRTIMSSLAPGASNTFTVVPSESISTAKKHEAIVTVYNTEITANNNFIVEFTSTFATVTFNSNGGGSVSPYTNRTYVSPYTNRTYGTISKPADPTLPAGKCCFGGWYKDNTTFNEEWDFESDNVSETMTLYAKWFDKKTVTFNSDGGSTVDPTSYTDLCHTVTTVNKPADPTKVLTVTAEGLYPGTAPHYYNFDGWFAPSASTAFDFTNTNITGNITLKAEWSYTIINVSAQEGDNIVEKAVAYVKANAAEDKEFTLYLAADYTIAPQQINVDNFKLTIVGLNSMRTIKRDSNGLWDSIFIFINYDNTDISREGVELTIDNITLTDCSIIYIVNMHYGTFTMKNGSSLINDTSDDTGGGGISLNRSGTVFNMYGGVITGNSRTSHGGEVRVAGTFNMYGGKITGCTALDQLGGGVYVTGTFNMYDGEISNNKNLRGSGSSGFGGGVAVRYGGTFNMYGGVIKGNEAHIGGGVYVTTDDTFGDGKVRIISGTIYGSNESDESLRNIANMNNNSAAMFVFGNTAEHGTYSGEVWNKVGDFTQFNDNTIIVNNGVLQP
jgi:uncharacterized repeat protein (TIGR02543 family)